MGKERPILFKGRLVRRILANAKTQTRRIVKGAPDDAIEVVPSLLVNGGDLFDFRRSLNNPVAIRSPYGSRGDRLWVKETWQSAASLNSKSPSQIGEASINAGYAKPWAPLRYLADEHTVNGDTLRDFGGAWGKTRVSIHMPRWASRITLDITAVRVERLQDMTPEDAIAEGVDPAECNYTELVRTFAALWKSVNGAESWDANPWVWAITFKRVEAEAPCP